MSPSMHSRPFQAAFQLLFLLALIPATAQAQLGTLIGADVLHAPNVDTRFMPDQQVPYVPTRLEVVDGMLKLASVSRNDIVYDLGCGDGRIVIAAARDYGAHGVGIELEPELVAEAIANAKSAGVEKLVRFEKNDLFKTDFSQATVVTLFLLPEVLRDLRPQLWKQLKSGTRVVSHGFDMGPEWPPEKTEKIGPTPIHFWTIKDEHKKPTIDGGPDQDLPSAISIGLIVLKPRARRRCS